VNTFKCIVASTEMWLGGVMVSVGLAIKRSRVRPGHFTVGQWRWASHSQTCLCHHHAV